MTNFQAINLKQQNFYLFAKNNNFTQFPGKVESVYF